MQPGFSEGLERAAQLADEVRMQWLERPGVMAVGSGMERRRGRPTGQPAIIVVVERKLSPAQLAELGAEPLPGELEGIAVDVVEQQPASVDRAVQREIDRAIRQKDRVADSLLGQPNITGVGVGYKVTGGAMTGEIAIQVFVEEKLPVGDLPARGFTPVPSEIRGIPTDVVQAGPFVHTAMPTGSRGDRQDPLRGGLSIGYAGAPFHYGTLGAVVFDAANRPMVLSNEHVLDGDIGDTVHQPSPVGLDDSFDIDFQLDVCVPINFIRIDTPDTLGGSILAGAAAAAAIAAACSDDIDPTREGQQATVPPAGAFTQEEYTKVHIDYPSWPLPGTPFDLKVDWRYERRTDAGTFGHADTPARRNRHVLRYHRMFTNRKLYAPTNTIHLFGIVLPPEDLGFTTRNSITNALSRRIPCKYYHCVGILHPLQLDRSYPVVLRSLEGAPDDVKLKEQVWDWLMEQDLSEEERKLLIEHRQELCIYYGEFPAQGLPLGPWDHWMFVQTTNIVPPGASPLDAAPIIGGLPVSDQYRGTLDIACGPLVFEDDGKFDIELI